VIIRKMQTASTVIQRLGKIDKNCV